MSTLLVRGFQAAAFGFLLSTLPPRLSAAQEDGIALGIVYDTSGSMAESVRAANGSLTPKYVVAQQAFNAIIDRVQAFASNRSSSHPIPIEAGLFVFKGDNAAEAVKFGPWDAAAFRDWLKASKRPEGSTPLGKAIEAASRAVLSSKMPRKHVVVVTDGMNTSGPDPASVLRRLKKEAPGPDQKISVHLVAFDVAAALFAAVKKEGANVVGAADARQLNSQLEFIFERKILLEDEEPRPAAPTDKK